MIRMTAPEIWLAAAEAGGLADFVHVLHNLVYIHTYLPTYLRTIKYILVYCYIQCLVCTYLGYLERTMQSNAVSQCRSAAVIPSS